MPVGHVLRPPVEGVRVRRLHPTVRGKRVVWTARHENEVVQPLLTATPLEFAPGLRTCCSISARILRGEPLHDDCKRSKSSESTIHKKRRFPTASQTRLRFNGSLGLCGPHVEEYRPHTPCARCVKRTAQLLDVALCKRCTTLPAWCAWGV